MDRTYWHKQTTTKPLFEDLLWSRPENARLAGKLLIVGGNLHGFSAPAEAFVLAQKAGVGVARALLPDAIRKIVGGFIENGEFAPSTPSGSFSQKALDELLAQAAWADGVLITGDLGRNSETAIVLEKFLQKHQGQVTLTKDAIDYLTSAPVQIESRNNTCLVLSLSQLQRLLTALNYPRAVTLGMSLLQLVDLLNDFSQTHPFYIVAKHHESIVVAVNGQISTTKLETDKAIWRVATAAAVAVWWLQNPGKPFEAITTSIFESASRLT